MNLDELVSHFDGARPNGKGGFYARCPAHKDSKPSLSINRGTKGNVLKCHAGCTTDAILESIGLKKSDLFFDAPFEKAPVPTIAKNSWPTLESIIAAYEKRNGLISAKYLYEIPGQDLSFGVLRWDKPSGKEIRPVSKDASGWLMEFPKGPRPLFNLRRVLQAVGKGETVYVVEGEKCVEAAQAIGLTTCTSAGGSQAAAKTDWMPLAGADICILPDNDEPGRKYAQEVASILHGMNPKTLIKIVELPGLPPGGDIVDWLEGFGPNCVEGGLAGLIERTGAWEPGALMDEAQESLNSLIENKKPLEPRVGPGAAEGTKPKEPVEEKTYPKESTGRGKARPKIITFSDIQTEIVPWLWPGRFPLGKVVLLSGRPGCGKSLFSCEVAARLSNGQEWPDGSKGFDCESLFLAAEDNPGDTILPRLLSFGANPKKVHCLPVAVYDSPEGEREIPISLLDLRIIEQGLVEKPRVKFVIVDPIGSYLGDADSHRDTETRAVLTPISKLAEKMGVTFFLIAHTRKGQSEFADDMTLGSRAFTGVARAAWHLIHDPNSKGRHLLLSGKMNCGRPSPGLSFFIGGNSDDFTLRLEWEKEPIQETADEYLRKAQRRGDIDPPGTEWLKDFLEIVPRAAKEILAEGKKAGLSKVAIRRAREHLGIQPFKTGFQGEWVWCLPTRGKS